MTGVRVSYLERGDRVDLHSHKVSPSAFKLAGKVLDHKASDFRPEFDDARFYADVLGKNQLPEISSLFSGVRLRFPLLQGFPY